MADQIIGRCTPPTSSSSRRPRTRTSARSSGGALVCGDDRQRRRQAGHAAGAGADDRGRGRAGVRRRLRPDGADARGIVAAFLYRTDRVSLAPGRRRPGARRDAGRRRTAARRWRTTPTCRTRSRSTPCCPPMWTRSTGVDGSNVYTRAPQVAKFLVAAAPGASERVRRCGRSATTSRPPRTPGSGSGASRRLRRGDRRRDRGRRRRTPGSSYGGDLNVFPRPDDPIATSDRDTPSDQLGAALRRRAAQPVGRPGRATCPSSAYSYVFQGQAQTLDHLFVNDGAARRPGADAGRARQRRLAGRLRRRRRARRQRPRPAGRPVPLAGVAVGRRRVGRRGQHRHDAARRSRSPCRGRCRSRCCCARRRSA